MLEQIRINWIMHFWRIMPLKWQVWAFLHDGTVDTWPDGGIVGHTRTQSVEPATGIEKHWRDNAR